MDIDQTLWNKCVEFHGHECGGLMIGFKTALYAKKLLHTGCSEDEEIVCISENDACGVDAVQVILGCSAGKGNLLFKMRGKQAFSFYNRRSGESIRLVLKETDKMSREEKYEYLKSQPPEALFWVKDVAQPLPEKARIFKSCKCENCGEMTSENMLRLQNGKKLCLDCYTPFSRFLD